MGSFSILQPQTHGALEAQSAELVVVEPLRSRVLEVLRFSMTHDHR